MRAEHRPAIITSHKTSNSGPRGNFFEEEVDVSDHEERLDILVCGLGVSRGRLQRTRENDDRKFYRFELKG